MRARNGCTQSHLRFRYTKSLESSRHGCSRRVRLLFWFLGIGEQTLQFGALPGPMAEQHRTDGESNFEAIQNRLPAAGTCTPAAGASQVPGQDGSIPGCCSAKMPCFKEAAQQSPQTRGQCVSIAYG